MPAGRPKKVTHKAELIPSGIQYEKTYEQLVDEQVTCIKRCIKSLEQVASDLNLTPQESVFCQLYTANDPEHFADSTLAYSEAFGILDIKKASAAGKKLLEKKNINFFLDILLNAEGFNERTADQELYWTMKQRVNINAKLGALKLYNEIRGRVKQTVEHNHIHTLDYSKLSEKEVDQWLQMVEKAAGKKPVLEIEDAKED